MKKKKNKYAGLTNDQIIAAAEGDVQFGPQISQIRDLYTDASRQRVSDINSARQTAASAVAFANSQRPVTKAVYQRGAQQVNKTAADVNAVYDRSLGADSPYAAEVASEQGGARNRINESRIGALQDLTARATGAMAGRQLAINQARASYRDSKATLDQKLSDLLGQKSSYVSGRLATLGNEAANRQNKIDVAKIGAGAGQNKVITTAGAYQGKTPAWVKNHPQQAQALVDAWNKAHPGGQGAGGGTRASVKDRGDFSDTVNAAIVAARDVINAHPDIKQNPAANRQAVAAALIKGHVVGKNADPNTQVKKYPPLAVQIALDQVINRYVSRGAASRLHQRGIKVGDVANVVSYTDWLPGELARQRAAEAKRKRDAAARNRQKGTVFGQPIGRVGVG